MREGSQWPLKLQYKNLTNRLRNSNKGILKKIVEIKMCSLNFFKNVSQINKTEWEQESKELTFIKKCLVTFTSNTIQSFSNPKINRIGNEPRPYNSQKTQAIKSNSEDNYNGGFHYYANGKLSQLQKGFPKEPHHCRKRLLETNEIKAIAKQFRLVTYWLIWHMSSVGVTLEHHWLRNYFLENG